MKTLARRLALVVALVFLPLAAAFAQAFPAKPVHIIVPFPPGGGADALARVMGPHLTPFSNERFQA